MKNMKKSIILLLFLAFVVGNYGFASTSVPQIGAKWYYSSIFMTPDMGYYQLEYMRDTLISDKTCMVVERIDINSKKEIVSKSNIYLLYDCRKILQFINSKYHLLYDFNVEIGDTINTSYSFTENKLIETQMKLKVTEAKDTLINSLTLRCYSFDCIGSSLNNGSNNSCVSFSGKAIENIGNITNYYFPIDCTVTDMRKPTDFRCFQNDSFIYKSKIYESNECDSVYVYPPNSLNEQTFNNDLKLILNAENNCLTVNCSDNDNHEFAVYDALGKIRIKGELKNDIQVSIKCLNPGIYFLIVRFNTNSIKLKFIKK